MLHLFSLKSKTTAKSVKIASYCALQVNNSLIEGAVPEKKQ